MNIAGFRDRVRRTSPLSGAVTPREEFTNLWHVENLNFTPEIKPGRNTAVSFEVTSNESFHDPTNPNTCWTTNAALGSRVRAVLVVDGSDRTSDTECVRGGQAYEYQLSFIAGQDGTTHDCAIELRNAATGNTNTRREFQVHVTEDAVVGDCPPGFEKDSEGNCVPSENGNGGSGPLLPCFLDPNRSCGTPEVVAWGGLLLMMIVLIAD